MGEVRIRAYEPQDRAAVRRICVLTGYMGDPADWLWSDAESFADIFTSYYTDLEPESALVAEDEGRVVGYLLGCVDSRRASDPTAVALRRVVGRWLWLRRGTAGYVWRTVGDALLDALRGRLPPRPRFDERWPAHLHVDLLPEARGRGVGAALVRRWLGSLRAKEVPGCHLETLAENHRAVAFFEAMGFRREGEPVRVPGLRSPRGERHHLQLMVQPLDPLPVET
jgi:ribosomal protein S18 acetylase RimI-like enzyme